MKHKLILLALGVSLVLAGSTLAMSSTNYRLDWFVPMTGSGGPASSAHYAANLTVGQTVSGGSSSAHYGMGLGYWYGLDQATPETPHLYLPIVVR